MAADASDGNGWAVSRTLRILERIATEVDAETDLEALDGVSDAAAELQLRTTRRRRTLRTERPLDDDGADEWIGVSELAQLIHRSVSTIRHLPPDAIPGRRQLVPGGKVEWNARIVRAWRRAPCSGT
jgi:hypothetical protein